LGHRRAKLTLASALIAIMLVSASVFLIGSIIPFKVAAYSQSPASASLADGVNAYGAAFQDPWFNENWAYRRPITINNSNNSSQLENYQVEINVTYDAGMRADFGDLRFCDNDGVTELSYWIENYTENENAAVWVKVPSIPGNDNHTIYMYYGNLGAETKGDGSAVFEFFDNFDNSTRFSTVAYPYGDPDNAIPENSNYVEFGNNGNEEYIKLGCFDEGELRENLNLSLSSYGIVVAWRSGLDYFSYDNADYTNYDDAYGASTITPKRLIVVNENKIYEKDNRLIYYSDRTEVNYNGAIENLYLSVGSSGGVDPYFTYYDLAFVRKSTDPEPTTGVGEEEPNMPPRAPILLAPGNNAYENDNTPSFMWESSIDPEGDHIIYTLQIDNDPSFSGPPVYMDNLITENQLELPAETALPDGVYYWRVGSRDMVNSDNWSENFTLTIDTAPPPAPSPELPSNGTILNDNTPTFVWSMVTDSSGVTYELQVDNDPDFSSPEVEQTGLVDNSFTPTAELMDENYSWRARAIDGAGNVGQWSVIWTIIIDTTPPQAPTLTSPGNGSSTGTPNVLFRWSKPESNLTYHIQIDDEPSFTTPYVHENLSITENSYYYAFARAGVYYWRVRAHDQAGNWSGWSENFKLTISVTVMPRTPHGPIFIENDDNFNISNGVVAGTGTENSPYIIENWAISAATTDGIHIKNTRAHFIVRNCLVENGMGGYFVAIWLNNVVNGRIEKNVLDNSLYGVYLVDLFENNIVTNNTSSNNYDGIYLALTSNTTVTNNICSNNTNGIALYPASTNNTLENNQFLNNLRGIYLRYSSNNNSIVKNTSSNNTYGIDLSGSDNTTLDNNTCSNNLHGIYLEDSTAVKMRSNTLSNNQYNFGVTGATIAQFVHDIDQSNLVDGKPIRYLVDNEDLVIAPPSQVGYLALVNCDNIQVDNLVLLKNEQGILLVSTTNSRVENCVIENDNYGIYLTQSDNNSIYHNNLLNNENQARDDGSNRWDDGYPSGGNYWSDYTGSDNHRGENQDLKGSDGIGDVPHGQDRYPLMQSWPRVRVVVSLSISPNFQKSLPGENLIYTVTLTNYGNTTDNYELTASDNSGWTIELSDNLFMNVPPLMTKMTMLTVGVPDNIGNSTRDNINVTVTSQTDNTVSEYDSCIAQAVILVQGIEGTADIRLATQGTSPYLWGTHKAEVTADLLIGQGDNLRLVFLAYDNKTVENETVIWSRTSPGVENVNLTNLILPQSGLSINIERVKLVLTDNVGNVILDNMAWYRVVQDDWSNRISWIILNWGGHNSAQQDQLSNEISTIIINWGSVPTVPDQHDFSMV
jgi:parallel beta-helix repeat protein